MIDKKLIQLIKEGDEKAFRIVYELYFSKVANYAYRLLHSQDDAREIAQDVFLKIWTKRQELDPEQSVSGLMFKMTKFLTIDKIRKLEKEIKTSAICEAVEIENTSLETDYLGKELHSVYLGSVKKLPQKRRLIFQLSRNSSLSYKEIAEKLNISTKTVEAQIRLALRQIREDIVKYSAIMVALCNILFS